MMSACPACAAVPLAAQTAQGPAQQFSLPGIHCAACIGKIERGLQMVIGVDNVRVNLSQKRLSVGGTVDPSRIVTALSDLGFEAYPLDLDSLEQQRDHHGRALLTRLAIAGFAMMNVMLLSVAVWSGAWGATRDLFHLISALIALPVIAYAGQPFFHNAWSALRARRLNMDVPISLAIVMAAGMSLFETLHGGAHAYFDAALSLTFFLLIGRYLDHCTRNTARSAAKELTALEVQTAERVTKGHIETVPANDLRVGDTVLVPTGARVPVDGQLLSDSGLMDRALLTGESAAITVQTNALLQAGEINLGAPCHIRALAVGADTSLRRMADLIATAENGRNSYTALADKAAQIYAPAVHLLALAAFLGWAGLTGDLRQALNIAISVLIITCPCALGLAVPAVSTAAIGRLFDAGFLVKHSTALERLADIDHIIFDKTGTLTLPAISFSDWFTDQDKAIAKALAQTSHHPISKALIKALPNITPAAIDKPQECVGQGVKGIHNGQQVRLGRGAWLGAPCTSFGLQIGNAPALEITTTEDLRPGVLTAFDQLRIPCEIITGDASGPANTLANRVGLPVTAHASPQDKLDQINLLTSQGHAVLMVGDGLNDTAALAAAHASIAPSTALEASRNAADIVALTHSFADLPLVLKIATASRRLSKQNFAIAAIYNCIAVPIAIAGLATPLAAALAMSASSITVLLNSQRMRFIK